MRVVMLCLALVGCGSTTAAGGEHGGAGGVAGASDPLGGSGGTAVELGGSGGSVETGGTVEVAGAVGEGGSAGDVELGGGGPGLGGSGGSAGHVAAAGAGGKGPAPGSLWTTCPYPPTLPLYCSSELTCGQYLEREGGQPGYVCTFACWSIQTGPDHVPKMAPDAALTAKCTAVGGVCYAASSGYYPTCVPGLPT
jgi:hypothetical protein